MKRVYRISCVVLSILLISPVTTWADSCPEGQKWNDRTGDCVKDRTSSSKNRSTTRKGKWHPYGGTCEDLKPREAISLASKIISGEPFRLNRGASVCKHNVELIENNDEQILKISARLGDGIRSSDWSDIKKGNRRRFEFMFVREIRINTGFRLEYSVRVTQDNTFLQVPGNQFYWFWITQLHPGGIGASVMVVKVDRREGLLAFDHVIQDTTGFGAVKTDYTPERFGKWVKIAIEFKPSRKNGFRRLWVDDQMVVEENNVQTIWDSTTSKTFSLKFGIYQGIESGGKNPPAIRNDDQQSIQFKNFHFKRI